jgi:uncharacterized protein YcbX
MAEITIRELNVYPVKSLRGISVQQWPLQRTGLAWDRHWMLVMPNGRFVTQRQLPSMALIDTAIENEQLLLSANGKGQVSLPLHATAGDTFNATVWRDQCEVIAASEEASAWLTDVLNAPQPLKLVRMAPGSEREQSCADRFGSHQTYFADAAPLLVANQASLDALNQTLQERQLGTVDMRRFRPNIVVEGLNAFEEQRPQEWSGGDATIQLVDHCERCIMTTIDPDSAEKHPDMQPYKTLAEINPMPDNPRAAAFGVNAVVTRMTGDASPSEHSMLAVGDRLSVSGR